MGINKEGRNIDLDQNVGKRDRINSAFHVTVLPAESFRTFGAGIADIVQPPHSRETLSGVECDLRGHVTVKVIVGSPDRSRPDDRLGGDELRPGEAGEATAGHDEFVERAGLDDPAHIEDKDTGRLAHRR
jgi:hypothetical protein